MPAEQIGAGLRVLPGFDAAELGLVLAEHRPASMSSDWNSDDEIAARFGDQLIGKEVAIADDDRQRGAAMACLLLSREDAELIGVRERDELAVDGLLLRLAGRPVVMNWCA